MTNALRLLKQLLNALGGYGLDPDDGNLGPKTLKAFDKEMAKLQKKPLPPATPDSSHPQNPAYIEAQKYRGKGENSPAFVAWLSKYWPKVGLKNYKTIIGASFAWCGLFFAAMHTDTGLEVIKGAAGARNWRNAGVAIEWVKDGIPQGAEVYIDHQGNCDGSGSHITWADADCAPQNLIEMKKNAQGVWVATSNPPKRIKGATFPGFGGNQSNTVKTSNFGVFEICDVRWPHEVKKPGPVLVSTKSCGALPAGSDSTK